MSHCSIHLLQIKYYKIFSSFLSTYLLPLPEAIPLIWKKSHEICKEKLEREKEDTKISDLIFMCKVHVPYLSLCCRTIFVTEATAHQGNLSFRLTRSSISFSHKHSFENRNCIQVTVQAHFSLISCF